MAQIVKDIALKEFCKKALIQYDMNENNASLMSDALVKADMWGLYTHGSKNLYGYLCKAIAKGVSFTSQPTIQRELPSCVVIEGNNTMGYISATMGMKKAIQIAETTGIGLALVKNSCHFGATGVYSNMAAENGMIVFAASNVDNKMGIPGAKGMVMGHNPFSFAAPATILPSVILDISSSNVASLRVLKAKAMGQSIPKTWITDVNGLPTEDPSRYPDEGALMPMGNHKGYGIAMFIEIMTSILLGQPTSTEEAVCSWCFDLEKPNKVCHIFIAINPLLLSDGNFVERVDKFVNELHNAPKAIGATRIKVPGEDMWDHYIQSKNVGLLLPDDVVAELEKVSQKTGIKL